MPPGPSSSGKSTISILPAAPAARQLQLFVRKALIEHPPAVPTADSLGEVEADDRFRYYVKADAHGRAVRASEWVATHIAEEVHIGAPTPMVIEMLSGSTVFGSRKISGVSDQMTTANFLITPTVSNQGTPIAGLQGILSSIYALDMFVNNDDRHLGNYLSIDDNGTRRLYAFDYSRAMFWDWPWNSFPSAASNTRKMGKLLRQFHGFDQGSAFSTLDRLGSLSGGALEGFINRMPVDWLPNEKRQQLTSWWNGSDRPTRVSNLKKGMSDGTLL